MVPNAKSPIAFLPLVEEKKKAIFPRILNVKFFIIDQYTLEHVKNKENTET